MACSPLDGYLDIVLLCTEAANKVGKMCAVSFGVSSHFQIVYLVLVLSFAPSVLTTSRNTLTCSSELDSANVTGTTFVNDYYLGLGGEYGEKDRGVLIDEPMNTTAYGDGHNISYSIAISNSTLPAIGQYPVLETAIWTGQPPPINLYSGTNSFSACAIVFSGLPVNTIRLGQSDDGSCAQTLSTACMTKLSAKLALFAGYQVADPLWVGGFNNLTYADGSSALPQICDNIAQDVGYWAVGDTTKFNAIPEECQPYMYNETLSYFTGPPVMGVRMFDQLDLFSLFSPGKADTCCSTNLQYNTQRELRASNICPAPELYSSQDHVLHIQLDGELHRRHGNV